LRVVEWYKYKYTKTNCGAATKKVSQGYAVFHQFGYSVLKVDAISTGKSTAIIELPDGTIEEVSMSMIRFKNPIYRDIVLRECLDSN
jgi:hypothetical protein